MSLARARSRTASCPGHRRSSGLGEAACEGFAAAGARVHMLVRNADRGEGAVARIESRLPEARGAIELELCDLSNLTSVRRFAETFQARCERLDLLVNNAGVLPPERTYNPDGSSSPSQPTSSARSCSPRCCFPRCSRPRRRG